MKGKIIVIDGMDGTGKNTQSKLLYAELKKKTDKVAIFSFPAYWNDSSFFVKKYLEGNYRNIKNPVLHSLLYSLDRALTYHEFIKEKYYNEGYIIIMDRYYISNVFYQLHNYTDRKQVEFCKKLYEIEVENLEIPKADYTFILTADPKVSNILLNKRYNNDYTKRDANENIDFQNIVFHNIIDFNSHYYMFSLDKYYGDVSVLQIHGEDSNIYSEEYINKKIMNALKKDSDIYYILD